MPKCHDCNLDADPDFTLDGSPPIYWCTKCGRAAAERINNAAKQHGISGFAKRLNIENNKRLPN